MTSKGTSQPSRGPSFNRALVEGPIPRAVWTLAWPTLVQNMIAGLQGIVDHAMVGHFVGYTGNAAIGVSWQIFLVVVVFVSSLYSGMGILVARFAGAGQSVQVNRVVYQAFLTSILLSLSFLAPLGYFFAPQLLELVHAAPEVQAEALPYLRILFVYSFGMLLFFMLGGALRAAGDAKTPLLLGASLTALNLTLNVIFIRGLGPIPAFGTRGAAMGTVLAAGLVALVALYLLFSDRLVIRLSRQSGYRPDFGVIVSLFRFGLPTGFQGIAMNLGGVILIRYVGTLQESAHAQAAYTVGYTQLFSLITWSGVALMSAAATVAGQNLGAQRPERARRAPRSAAAMGLCVAIPMGAAYLLVPNELLGLFGLRDPVVLAYGKELLSYLSLSGLFLAVALPYNGALQGTGDTKSPLYITLVSQLALPLALCAGLDWAGRLEAPGIWFAIVLGHGTRSLLSVLRFRQEKWRAIEIPVPGAPLAQRRRKAG